MKQAAAVVGPSSYKDIINNNNNERKRTSYSSKQSNCRTCSWGVKLKRGLVKFLIFALSLIALFLTRKFVKGVVAIRHVRQCEHQISIESLLNDREFQQLTAAWRYRDEDPIIFIMNQYVLEMTFNFLCNVNGFPGVIDRFVFVTLDQETRDEVAAYWPNVRQYYRPTECLKVPFRYGDPAYQTFMVFRLNLAAALVKSNISYWMMQQDTVWHENVLDYTRMRSTYLDSNLVFDRLGGANGAIRENWMNGANFYVRHTPGALRFFTKGAEIIANHWVVDVGAMIMLCGTNVAKCGFFPHSTVSCWEWLHYGDANRPPYIIQMDAEFNQGTKFQNMKEMGFNFLLEDGRSCNSSAVERARMNLEKAHRESVSHQGRSLWRYQWSFYWFMTELLLKIPFVSRFLYVYLPLGGYYFQMTM